MFVSRGNDGSPRFLFSSNQRDKSTFDLYEADAATRTVKEVARSDGQVLGWLTGSQRQLAGRVRQRGTSRWLGHRLPAAAGRRELADREIHRRLRCLLGAPHRHRPRPVVGHQ
jgi:hypothetical protein